MNSNFTRRPQPRYSDIILIRYYPLPLIVIGTIGNFSTLYIYSRPEFLKSSTAFYFIYSTIIDILCLYFSSIRNFSKGFFLQDLKELSNFLCKSITYMKYTSMQLSSWILVLISVDGLFIILGFKSLNKYRTKKNQVLILLIMTIFFFILNVPFPIIIELDTIKNNSRCHYFQKSSGLILSIYDLLLSVVLPFLSMVCINTINSYKLFKLKNRVIDRKRSLKNAANFGLTVIARNILFFCLNLPINLVVIVQNLKFDKSVYVYELSSIEYIGMNILSDVNYSINFLVHLAVNQQFRKRFIKFKKKSLLKIRL